MELELWYIKKDVIDEVVEYINFVNNGLLVARKSVLGRNNRLFIKIPKKLIKHKKKDGVSKTELKKQVHFHVENVVLKFESDKEWIYKNNKEFTEFITEKRKIENRKEAVKKFLGNDNNKRRRFRFLW